MHVTFVAGYGWWPVSGPIMTFLKYFQKLNVSCSILGAPIHDVLIERFSPEPELYNTPVITVKRTQGFSYHILKGHFRHFLEKRVVIYFDEQSLLRSYHLTRRFASGIYLYSTEIPEGIFISTRSKISRILSDNKKVRLIIQDEDRLRLFEKTFAVKASHPIIIPNSNLSNHDYILQKPNGINFPESKRVIILTGSLIPEHCICEMIESFAKTKKDFSLFINGWIPDKKYELKLKALISNEDSIMLSTKFLSGSEIRWIYDHCYAGIVSYSNETNNHRLVGMSSGKLFWLCRYGKPIICNDNVSISKIVGSNGLGINALDGMDLDCLEKNYSEFSNNCKKFYSMHAFDRVDGLKELTQHDFS